MWQVILKLCLVVGGSAVPIVGYWLYKEIQYRRWAKRMDKYESEMRKRMTLLDSKIDGLEYHEQVRRLAEFDRWCKLNRPN